jgi:hypothetical protein
MVRAKLRLRSSRRANQGSSNITEGPALAGSSDAAPSPYPKRAIAGGRARHGVALPLRGASLGDGRSSVLDYSTLALRGARRTPWAFCDWNRGLHNCPKRARHFRNSARQLCSKPRPFHRQTERAEYVSHELNVVRASIQPSNTRASLWSRVSSQERPAPPVF